MNIRKHLIVLTIGAIVPLLVVAVCTSILLVRNERSKFEREAIGRARAAMSAIDAELRGAIATLQALAASQNLETGDIRAFHAEAQRVLATQQPGWRNIGLATVSRVQLMDAVLPYGASAPFGADDSSFENAIRTRLPVVGDITPGPAVITPSVRIRVPVIVGGAVRYVLSAPIDPASFDKPLRAQMLPKDWVIELADREKRFITRIPPVPVGTPLSIPFKTTVDTAPEGWFWGHTLEGAATYRSYVTSPLSGWVLAIAMPEYAVDADVWSTFWLATTGVLVALAVALMLAWLIARWIAEPIVSLADAARGMSNHVESDAPTARRIDEIAQLQVALRDAFRATRDRQMLLESEQATILRLNQELTKANQRKDDFLATLAHELRNPLAPIRNCLTILKSAALSARERDKARDVIDRQVGQMARLLDDLLDVSRITHGKLELRRERVALAQVVETAIETSQPLLKSGGHELSVALGARPLYLDGDPIRLAQIISNLLTNAAKYSNEGTPIWLTADQRDNEIWVSIRDEGIGIGADLLPRVFDIFVQGADTVNRAQGLGIGLSLVRALAELHGGTVEACSDGPGKGSEFIVRLPAAPAPDGQPVVNSRSAVPDDVPASTILIVDDVMDNVESLSILLRELGHTVHTAYDGENAFRVAASSKPRIALLDIGMPNLNGYDLARRIRAQPWGKDILLVALSGWGQQEDRRRSKEAGFAYHLVKPVDLGELAAVLRTASPDS